MTEKFIRGSMPPEQLNKLRKAAMREIDEDPLYMQLAEKYSLALERINILENELTEKNEKSLYDFSFKDYSTGRMAAQKEQRGFDLRMGNGVMGLSGEVGEVAEHVKKWFYHGKNLDKDYLIKELGDVLWYVMYLADTLGSSLEKVAIENQRKLEERYPNGFSVEAAQKRSSNFRIDDIVFYYVSGEIHKAHVLNVLDDSQLLVGVKEPLRKIKEVATIHENIVVATKRE